MFTKIFDPESPQNLVPSATKVFVSTLNNLPVIQVKDSNSSRPLTIATVTQTDVDFYSQTPEQIIQNWQKIIDEEIAQIEYFYSPQVLRNRLIQAIAIFLGILVISSILGLMYWLLDRQVQKLQLKYDAGIEASNLPRLRYKLKLRVSLKNPYDH